MEVLGKGIIHFVAPGLAIASRGRHLYKSTILGKKWNLWCSLPLKLSSALLCKSRWLSRLTRQEIHNVIEVDRELFACFGFGGIYLVEMATGKVDKIGKITGSRALGVCAVDNKIYYGDYIVKGESQSIVLHSYNLLTGEWLNVHEFTDIRHIHGVYWDDYSSSLWITTGDLDDESAIIRFDNKMNPQKVVSGSQQTRAVDLLFTEDSVIYATDAPDEPNFIYSLDRQSCNVEKVQQVGGPVFWGRKDKDWLFFSTVVEPSEINRTDAVELWGSNDQGNSWKKIDEFKKDIGHLKLFQYGQIKFPNGPGDEKYLWFTPYATENDHRIMRLSLDIL